jgi:hypothetical protein
MTRSSQPLNKVFCSDARRAVPPPPKIARRPPRKSTRLVNSWKSEAIIQKEIVRWLLLRGVVLAITDAGMLHKAGVDRQCGIPHGWPDVTGCLPSGRFLGVECKASRGWQSVEQIAMQDRIEKNHGLYILAHSVDELVEAFHKEELLDNPTGLNLETP